MTSNDVLRQIRFALDLPDLKMIEIFAHSDIEMDQQDLLDMMKKEEEEGYQECPKNLLSHFLDGLIIQNRGRKDPRPDDKKPAPAFLSNNDILKKLRIALELREEDMLRVFSLGDFTINKAELTALFRSRSHRNYKDCGDQMLRYFIRGLTVQYRKTAQKQD